MPITTNCGPHCTSKHKKARRWRRGQLVEHHCNCKRCHGKAANGGPRKKGS